MPQLVIVSPALRDANNGNWQTARRWMETTIRVSNQEYYLKPKIPEIREDHQEILEQLVALVSTFVPEPYPTEWVALKLLEGDQEITYLLQDRMGTGWQDVHSILVRHEDAILAIASGRYDWIGRMMRAAVTKPRTGQIALTDRIDNYATHPFWGMVILLAVLGLTFSLTFTIGVPIQNWLDSLIVQSGSTWVLERLTNSPGWLQGLVVHGLISGVGTVLTRCLLGNFEFGTSQQIYYLILAGCLLVGFISRRLSDSRLGRAWMAIREDEDVAQAMGINLVATKLLAFATGAAFSALSGAIFPSKLPPSIHTAST